MKHFKKTAQMFKYNGVFVVDKPKNIGSTQVVEKLKWTFINSSEDKNKKRVKNSLKIGHGGALDPFATGALAIGVGTGTKELGHMTNGTSKEYIATVFMGHETTTCDREGHVVKSHDSSHITAEQIAKVLDKFRGDIKQFPPVYSSVSVDGMRLWDYARSGLSVPYIPSRECHVDKLELISPVISCHTYNPLGQANEEEMTVAAGVAKIKKDGGDMTREEYEKSKEGQPKVSKKQLKKNKKRKYNAEEVAAVVRDPVPEVEETQTHEKSLEEREKEYRENLAKEEVSELNKFAKEQVETGTFKPKTPIFQILASVSSGTYIRQLANDICEELGVSGHLVELRRTTQGSYGVENFFPLDLILNQPEEKWESELTKALKEGAKYVYTKPAVTEDETKPEAETSEVSAETVTESPATETSKTAETAETETATETAETDAKKQKTE
ncbi:putative tRNA pseudouridine synthase 1 [Yarrowia sp. C11]|nr:putative tRNA pseudouridine synthase 1 [Yarrowia sp. E02]KAG5367796.1 putative tRNA pseudouridine synthase 1 [Yarrowia sp. C11]